MDRGVIIPNISLYFRIGILLSVSLCLPAVRRASSHRITKRFIHFSPLRLENGGLGYEDVAPSAGDGVVFYE
jgi:hypothetical protein